MSLSYLITGAASGLGKAVAEFFLQRSGSQVALLDLAAEPPSTDPVFTSGLWIPGDVTSEESVRNAIDVIRQKFGRLNVVVNCAGTCCAFLTYNHNKKRCHDLEIFKNVLNVNVAGTFNVIRLASFLLAENEPDEEGQRGVIVNTSSIASTDGQIGQVAYASSKGAISAMTLPLARDLSNLGIRVCSISPGPFDTPLLSSLSPVAIKFLGKLTPFPKRLGKPIEFAMLVDAIVKNPFLNGEVIRLDGALRMQP